MWHVDRAGRWCWARMGIRKMNNIFAAYELIASFDKGAADLWLKSPFQRHTLVSAMFPEMERSFGTELAERVSVLLRRTIDMDRQSRRGDA